MDVPWNMNPRDWCDFMQSFVKMCTNHVSYFPNLVILVFSAFPNGIHLPCFGGGRCTLGRHCPVPGHKNKPSFRACFDSGARSDQDEVIFSDELTYKHHFKG